MQTTEERRVAAAKWSNGYCQRVEEVLEQNANELHEIICSRVDAVGWDEVKETKGGWWLIFPVVQAYNCWFEKQIEPLLVQATCEFRSAIGLDPDWRKGESVSLCPPVKGNIPVSSVRGANGLGVDVALVILSALSPLLEEDPFKYAGYYDETYFLKSYKPEGLKLLKQQQSTVQQAQIGEHIGVAGKVIASVRALLQERVRNIYKSARNQIK